MTTFYLIRHGEALKDAGDPDLSELGCLQAQSLADFIKTKSFLHLYTSPLKRAKATATRIASIVAVPLREDSRLRERMNWGDLPGQSCEEFVALWNYCNIYRTFIPPKGLSSQQAGDCLIDFLQEMHRAYPEAELGVVTHGGILGDFLTNNFSVDYLAGLHAEWPSRESSIFAHCSITIVECQSNQFSVKALASTMHLS